MIAFGALVAVILLAAAVAYAYRNRKDEDGSTSAFGHMLNVLVVVILGCAVIVAVILTLNALDLTGVRS